MKFNRCLKDMESGYGNLTWRIKIAEPDECTGYMDQINRKLRLLVWNHTPKIQKMVHMTGSHYLICRKTEYSMSDNGKSPWVFKTQGLSDSMHIGV